MNKDAEFNFTVLDEEGNEVVCDVISVLQDKNTQEVFVVYTDYTLKDNDQFNIYISQLVEKKGKYGLKKIESKEKYMNLIKNSKEVFGNAIEKILTKES